MSPFGMFAPKVGHQALYNDLCKLHDIDRKTKPVLDAMVQALGLKEQPAMVFIDPNCFLQAAQKPELAEHLTIIRELSYRWFGKRV